MATAKTTEELCKVAVETNRAMQDALAEVLKAGIEAMDARDMARKRSESLQQALLNRESSPALDTWLTVRSGDVDRLRSAEEMEQMQKLETWWTENDGESRSAWYIWREKVTFEEGVKILKLWGFQPEARSCSCEHDCCGHWFTNGVQEDFEGGGWRVWRQGWSRNV